WRRAAIQRQRDDFGNFVGMQFAHPALHLHVKSRASFDDQEKVAIILDRVAPSINRSNRPDDIHTRREAFRDQSARNRECMLFGAGGRENRSQLMRGPGRHQRPTSRSRRLRNSFGVHRYLKALRSLMNTTGTSIPKRASRSGSPSISTRVICASNFGSSTAMISSISRQSSQSFRV